jgi:hypothetical protein
MTIEKPVGTAEKDDATIQIIRDGKVRVVKPLEVNASLRHFSVITDGAGALVAEYGNTLFPDNSPYEFSFPRDPEDPSHRGNIDYRDEEGVYFIAPLSGKFVVTSEDSGAPNTYKNTITYTNLQFAVDEKEVTINGTGEATFIFD